MDAAEIDAPTVPHLSAESVDPPSFCKSSSEATELLSSRSGLWRSRVTFKFIRTCQCERDGEASKVRRPLLMLPGRVLRCSCLRAEVVVGADVRRSFRKTKHLATEDTYIYVVRMSLKVIVTSGKIARV